MADDMMLDSKDMDSLRKTNKALLERLKGNQKEFSNNVPRQKERLGKDAYPPSSLGHMSDVNPHVPVHRAQPDLVIKRDRGIHKNIDNQQNLNLAVDRNDLVKFVPRGESAAARAALCSPWKTKKMNKGQNSCDAKVSREKMAAAQATVNEEEICNYQKQASVRKLQEREQCHTSHVKQDRWNADVSTEEGGRHSVVLGARSASCTDLGGEKSQPEHILYADRLLDDGNNRKKDKVIKKSQKPKSILTLSRSADAKKGANRVMFQSSTERSWLAPSPWTVPPLLGYDWIAGLLETDFSVAEKSEQYFSELNEFRRVNQEECIHARYSDSQAPDFMSQDDKKDLSLGPHQCVFCYRVNMRLFPVPLVPETACPICKNKRSKEPESIEEPAYVEQRYDHQLFVGYKGKRKGFPRERHFAAICKPFITGCSGRLYAQSSATPGNQRVSIPRSTLLPPHKYKIHRRRSFDPSDSLALPSHCLAGWENAVPTSELAVTSLDLRTSVEPKIADRTDFSNPDLVSRVSGSAKTDHLLNLSRSTYFQMNQTSRS